MGPDHCHVQNTIEQLVETNPCRSSTRLILGIVPWTSRAASWGLVFGPQTHTNQTPFTSGGIRLDVLGIVSPFKRIGFIREHPCISMFNPPPKKNCDCFRFLNRTWLWAWLEVKNDGILKFNFLFFIKPSKLWLELTISNHNFKWVKIYYYI